MKNDISSAINQICEEKGISSEMVMETIEAALAAAYRKDFGHKNQNIKVEFDLKTGGMQVHDVKTVVEDALKEEAEALEKELREARERAEADPSASSGSSEEKGQKPEGKVEKKKAKEEESKKKTDDGGEEEEEVKKYNPKADISLTEAKEIKKSYKVGDEVRIELEVPEPFGRMAAQTAKQVIIQKLREAERDTLYNDFKEKESEVMNGVIQRKEGRLVFVDFGKITALLLPEEQVDRERYNIGERYKFYILSVNKGPKGPEILVSRAHAEIVKKVFEVEIPEIANGLIVIKSIAREAGSRTKISVESTQDNIDPIGSCVGQRGTRVQTIINELGGEKIDIIEHDDDIERYITNALSPAKISAIQAEEEEKRAVAKVKEDQLSLAIGKGGQNVRLAAKLTGWKIDIVAERESGEEEEVVKDGEVVAEAEEVDENAPEEQVTDDKEALKEEEVSEEKEDPSASSGSGEKKEEEDTKPKKKVKKAAKKKEDAKDEEPKKEKPKKAKKEKPEKKDDKKKDDTTEEEGNEDK